MCKATDECTLPVANRRTGRCIIHQRDFERASSRYSTMLNRLPSNEAPPVDWDTYIAGEYTDTTNLYTWLSPEDRHKLRKLLQRSSSEAAALRVAGDMLARNQMSPQMVSKAITKYLGWLAYFDREITELATDPTDVDEALGGAP